jgi:hypothetical protein
MVPAGKRSRAEHTGTARLTAHGRHAATAASIAAARRRCAA